MKILQIAPPVLPLSPNMKYGGIERVVRDLDEAYVKLGHESLVVASANSEIYGKLIPSISTNTWEREGNKARYTTNNDKAKENFERHCQRCLEIILSENPDAIHDHTKLITSDVYRESGLSVPILTTLHGDLDYRNIEAIKRIEEIRRPHINFFNAISNSQKRVFSAALTMDYTVLNAINTESYPYKENKRNFLINIGKMDRNKGQDVALKVAKNLKENLILAGPVHDFRTHIREYWEQEVEPFLDKAYEDIPLNQIDSFIDDLDNQQGKIIYIGEIDDSQKKKWLSNSKGFLMPIRWNEPFGLVMIEAMATGTPVVAYDMGAVQEIVIPMETGYIVEPNQTSDFIEATRKIEEIEPFNCRKRVENHFDIMRQAKDYLKIFEEIKNKRVY